MGTERLPLLFVFAFVDLHVRRIRYSALELSPTTASHPETYLRVEVLTTFGVCAALCHRFADLAFRADNDDWHGRVAQAISGSRRVRPTKRARKAAMALTWTRFRPPGLRKHLPMLA